MTVDQPVPAISHRRTAEQVADPVRSWQRDDVAFFAAGACHILAWRALARWPTDGLELIHLRPRRGDRGHHVYVTDGHRAFDFNGWTTEENLTRVNRDACRREDPGWACDRVVVDPAAFAAYCRTGGLRGPQEFPGDVVARADRFLELSAYEPPPPAAS